MAPIGAKTAFKFFFTFDAPHTTEYSLWSVFILHIFNRSAFGCCVISIILAIRKLSKPFEKSIIDSTSKPKLVKLSLILSIVISELNSMCFDIQDKENFIS